MELGDEAAFGSVQDDAHLLERRNESTDPAPAANENTRNLQ